jgi:hypothetical protein
MSSKQHPRLSFILFASGLANVNALNVLYNRYSYDTDQAEGVFQEWACRFAEP